MKRGDIIVNPYVSKEFDGHLNPNYATIYIGNNKTVDYRGRICSWASKVDEWQVIEHCDLFGFIKRSIETAIEE